MLNFLVAILVPGFETFGDALLDNMGADSVLQANFCLLPIGPLSVLVAWRAAVSAFVCGMFLEIPGAGIPLIAMSAFVCGIFLEMVGTGIPLITMSAFVGGIFLEIPGTGLPLIAKARSATHVTNLDNK